MRPCTVSMDIIRRNISIHAPRAGCDRPRTHGCVRGRRISIHAPRAGCDVGAGSQLALSQQFQSTHPVRGATDYLCSCHYKYHYFNPRTPCGVRLSRHLASPRQAYFNPRTPCGVRPFFCVLSRVVSHFKPRTPCGVRRRTYSVILENERNFNPRTPCGVRHPPTNDRP